MSISFKNRRFVTSVLAAGLLVGVFGAQGRPNGNEIQAVPLPDGVVVFGEIELTLEQGTNVLSGETASNKTAVVQREGLLIGSLVTDRAILGFNVRILGNLEADRITGPNFIIEGETISPRVTDNFAIPDLPVFTPGAENVRIEAGETATLQPGAFDRIIIEEGADVTLQGGAYNLRSLQVGHNVVFNLVEPVTLNILQHASFGNHTIFNLDSDLDINDIRINYAGTGVVTFGKETFAAGIVHAPNGTVFLHKDSIWRGQLAGRRVGVGKETLIAREVASTKLVDPEDIVRTEEGAEFPVNIILLNLSDATTVVDANEIAASVTGRVVGIVPSIGLYQIEVSTETATELDALIAEIVSRSDPRIESITKDFLLNLF